MAKPMRYAHENDFDAALLAAGSRWNVPVSLLKALVAQESEFNPNAIRHEPQLKAVNIPGLEHGGDASYGLMQVLFRTAWALGYRGQPEGLYNPSTNLDLGARFFGDLLASASNNGYGMDAAISAYNAGGSADRFGDGKRNTSRNDGYTTNGENLAPFVNQTYVNRVLANYEYFRQASSVGAGAGSSAPSGSSAVPGRAGTAQAGLLVGLVGAVALMFFFRLAGDSSPLVAASADSVGGQLTRFLVAVVGAEASLTAWMLHQAYTSITRRLETVEGSVNDLRTVVTALAAREGLLSVAGGKAVLHE